MDGDGFETITFLTGIVRFARMIGPTGGIQLGVRVKLTSIW